MRRRAGWRVAALTAAALTLPGGVARAAAPCPAAPPEPALACLVDAERAARDLPPLRHNAALARAADAHAAAMVEQRFFSHVTPTGDLLVERVRRAGYLMRAREWWLGECLAWGQGPLAEPAAIVQAWMHSPGHRRLLLARHAREAGIGVARGVPRPGDWPEPALTVTLDLGRRR